MGSVLRYHALLQHNNLLGILCRLNIFKHSQTLFLGERLERLQVCWWFQPLKQRIHTSRARASRVTEVSKGRETYKEKGEFIGTKPDRLVVKAIGSVISWNSLSLTFLSLDILF